MSTTKRISGDYTLQSINPTDKININTSAVVIAGNLVVSGTQTTVSSVNTSIWDNIITLNGGTSPSQTPTQNAGLEVDRGIHSNVQLIWNETVTAWQITNDGSTYSNIASAGTSLANVYQDPAPRISANLNITGHTIFDSAQNVVFYAGTPNSGKSGVYVDNTNGTQQELVTKSAAIAYSIIFG